VNAYAVSLSARALDWLEDCRDTRLKQRIVGAIDALAANPHPPGCVKLAGEEIVWRVRVGSYRILYEIHEGRLMVLVIRIAHRREVYR